MIIASISITLTIIVQLRGPVQLGEGAPTQPGLLRTSDGAPSLVRCRLPAQSLVGTLLARVCPSPVPLSSPVFAPFTEFFSIRPHSILFGGAAPLVAADC